LAAAARGISMELRLIEKTSRQEVLRLYVEAEIIADQFCMVPAHGDFWPVPVDELLPEIQAALERLATTARSESAVRS
jgi:hypothetical protein